MISGGQLDMGRMREALVGPIDSRAWCAMARVDDDPDAIRLDDELGWLVDVTIQGGPYHGEEPTCRVSQALAANASGTSTPVSRDCEVVLLMIQGEFRVPPVILGQVHNADGCVAPSSVNGQEITEEFALATQFVVSPYAVEEQYAGDRRVSAPNQTIETPATGKLSLAQFGATQPFVKGTDQKEALDRWRTALDLLLAAYATALDTLTGTGAASGAFSTYDLAADVAFQQLQAALSTRIAGE